MTCKSRGYPIADIQLQKVQIGQLYLDTNVIPRRLPVQKARREPITIENFVIDTITERMGRYEVLLPINHKKLPFTKKEE